MSHFLAELTKSWPDFIVCVLIVLSLSLAGLFAWIVNQQVYSTHMTHAKRISDSALLALCVLVGVSLGLLLGLLVNLLSHQLSGGG